MMRDITQEAFNTASVIPMNLNVKSSIIEMIRTDAKKAEQDVPELRADIDVHFADNPKLKSVVIRYCNALVSMWSSQVHRAYEQGYHDGHFLTIAKMDTFDLFDWGISRRDVLLVDRNKEKPDDGNLIMIESETGDKMICGYAEGEFIYPNRKELKLNGRWRVVGTVDLICGQGRIVPRGLHRQRCKKFDRKSIISCEARKREKKSHERYLEWKKCAEQPA